MFLIQAATGNGTFEVSGSSINTASNWTISASGGDAAGRNAGASAHAGTGAFAVSSGASISGSASATSLIPTIIGHTYEAKAWVSGTPALNGDATILLGENATPVTLASGSASAFAQYTKDYTAAGTSFKIVVAPTGLGDVIVVDDVTLEDTTTFNISASGSAHGTVAPSGVTAVAYGASQVVSASASAGYHISSVTIDGVLSYSDGRKSTVFPTYQFSAVAAAHTFAVVFAAGAGGLRYVRINEYYPLGGDQRFGKYIYKNGQSVDQLDVTDLKVMNHLDEITANGFSYTLI